MRAVQIQDYAREYLNKSDSELLQLASQREHLTVEAGAALQGELARRKINALEEPAIFRKEHTQLDQLVSSPTVQSAPTGVGPFVAKVLKLYHDHFWFFFKLTLPVVAVSWITILATNREVREMSRQLQAAGHLSFALISQMLFVRVGGYLASWLSFCCLFGVICAATCQIESGALPDVSGSAGVLRKNLVRFLQLSLLLFAMLGVAMMLVGLLVGVFFFWRSQQHLHFNALTIRIVAYGLGGLVLLVFSRFGLAMPAVILDDCKVGQAIFRSDELTERKWLILASLLAKSTIGGYVAGMLPFWLAAFIQTNTPLPSWFSWALSGASVLGVAVVEPSMFIGFALLYLRTSALLVPDSGALTSSQVS